MEKKRVRSKRKADVIAWFKESSIRGLLLHLGLMVLVVFIMIILFFFLYLPSATNHGETVTVPDLEGMSLEEMDDYLASRKLRYEVSDSGYSADYPPLAILKQFPKANENVKENRKIYLTVKAKVPQSVRMPDLIDGSLKNAELVLRSYGLLRGQIKYVPDLAQNAVLKQLYEGEEIAAGEFVPKGSVIELEVGDGLGNRTFDMPNFVGLDLDEAQFLLEASGLRIGLIMVSVINQEESEDTFAGEGSDPLQQGRSGMITRQNPSSGATVRLGEQVDLWLASQNAEDSIRLTQELKDPSLKDLMIENDPE
ncbi:MAG: PASTA domain-containing protein [Cyclobacteriaceae bacterium]